MSQEIDAERQTSSDRAMDDVAFRGNAAAAKPAHRVKTSLRALRRSSNGLATLATIAGGVSLVFLAASTIDPTLRMRAKEALAGDVYVPLVPECKPTEAGYVALRIFDMSLPNMVQNRSGVVEMDTAIEAFERHYGDRERFSMSIRVYSENDFASDVVAVAKKDDLFLFREAISTSCGQNSNGEVTRKVMARGTYHRQP